jgi:hypothetical protein
LRRRHSRAILAHSALRVQRMPRKTELSLCHRQIGLGPGGEGGLLTTRATCLSASRSASTVLSSRTIMRPKIGRRAMRAELIQAFIATTGKHWRSHDQSRVRASMFCRAAVAVFIDGQRRDRIPSGSAGKQNATVAQALQIEPERRDRDENIFSQSLHLPWGLRVFLRMPANPVVTAGAVEQKPALGNVPLQTQRGFTPRLVSRRRRR